MLRATEPPTFKTWTYGPALTSVKAGPFAFTCPGGSVKQAKALKESDQKERYLRAVRTTGTLTAGCKAGRVSPNTVYQWREYDTEFVVLENQARTELADELEREAIRRAWHGTLKPVFHQGRQVGQVQEYSDTLLIFMLKAVRPEKYRERFDMTTQGQPLVKAYEGVNMERV